MKRIKTYFVILCVLLAVVSCSKPEPGQVKIENGWIQGTVQDSLTIFKGIPFAAPPVGNLRWKAPQPIEKWEGIKQTTEFAPGPMQGGTPPSGKSED
ncbi:MAG: carboxylesterase family protein, partial [Flavobacteriales bacterium]